MAAVAPLAEPSAVSHRQSPRFSTDELAAATSPPKGDARKAMIVYFRDILLSRIQVVEDFACELHSQKVHEPAPRRPVSDQGSGVEPFLSHQAGAILSSQGAHSQEQLSQHNRFHSKLLLARKEEIRPAHHAARRIARAWRLSKFRRTFLHFSEMEVGYVASLAWLEPRDFVFGGELADEDDMQHWMLQRIGAHSDKEVDPWGHHALRAHLLGLPRVEDDSIDKRLRVPQARHKKSWPKQRHKQQSPVAVLVAQLDETSQRMRFQRQQPQKQQVQQQQQQQQQQQLQSLQSLQGSIVWNPARRQNSSAPRTPLHRGATIPNEACPAVVPKARAHSQWLLGTITRGGSEGEAEVTKATTKSGRNFCV